MLYWQEGRVRFAWGGRVGLSVGGRLMRIHGWIARRGIQVGVFVLLLALVGAAMVVAGREAQPRRWTAQQVVDVFVEAGLEVAEVQPMTANEFLAAPRLAEKALFFPVWELKLCFCSDVPLAFVMTFDSVEDRDETRAYYDDLERQSVVFATWTFVRDNALVVLPGGLNEADAESYEAALRAMR